MTRALFIGLIFLMQSFWMQAVAQPNTLDLSRDVHWMYEKHLVDTGINYHSAIRPFRVKKINLALGSDSSLLNPSLADKILTTIDSGEVGGDYISLGPLLTLVQGSDNFDNTGSNLFSAGGGFFLYGDALDAIDFNLNFYSENTAYPSYIRNRIDSLRAVPGMGWAHGTQLGESFTAIDFRASFYKSKYFLFEAGYGKNFFGSGYRTFLMSDNSYNYPFFRMETTVWKIKYVNLFAMMRDFSAFSDDRSLSRKKFTASHYFSWNLTKRLNISIFESIVWPGQDSLLNRGFEINYLNPIIFYRPVEYSQGSADNALLGTNISLKLPKKTEIYGQAMFDEFLLAEIMADVKQAFNEDSTVQSGWWANKFGLQLGVKTFDLFGLENLSLQSEVNVVRPFTYTHGTVIQNYGHFNQPLAHSWGANFYEWTSIVNYRVKEFQFQEQLTIGTQGFDFGGGPAFGDNVFRSYNDRATEYGHETRQGLKSKLFYNHLRLSYLVDAGKNIRLELGHIYRRMSNSVSEEKTNYIYAGITTSIFNRYHDF